MSTNVFVTLALPVGNGVGAASVTSGMGIPKTITVEGAFPGATIVVEASVDGGTIYAPVVTLQQGSTELQVNVVADHMRVRVSGRTSTQPFSAIVGVGAPAATPLFGVIAIPAGNGVGAATDISAFGENMTFIAGGTFQGAAVRVEISEDNVAWQPLLAFTGKGGLKNAVSTAMFARCRVSGRSPNFTFSATLSVGAAVAVGGGSSSGNQQRFSYTVTGVEPDLQNLVIALPAARADALYLVTPSQEQATFSLGMNVQTASKTVAQFVLSLTAIATAGDKFVFLVADPT